jgi:hypothetical protein
MNNVNDMIKNVSAGKANEFKASLATEFKTRIATAITNKTKAISAKMFASKSEN